MDSISLLKSSHIEAFLNLTGGFLTISHVKLDDGRIVHPMLVNNWANKDGYTDLPNVSRYMSSEWVCVPHGSPAPPPDLPENWPILKSNTAFSEMHGYCANHLWTIDEGNESFVRLRIDYPQSHPIKHVSRRVELTGKTVLFSLSVTSRENIGISIGSHPVFTLSNENFKTHIDTSFKKDLLFR